MSSLNPTSNESNHKRVILWILGSALFIGVVILGALGFLVLRNQPIGQAISGIMMTLFATNSTHTTWYITRAAGWVAYFLLWFSTLWGLVIPTKFFERFLSPTFVVDFHEYISLLALGFVLLHVSVLLIDQYLPFTLVQILVPFMAPYRPFLVGLGVLGFYLSLLVSITFYLRKRIGQKRFKAIHLLSFGGYIFALMHAFFSGSDSSLPMAQYIYMGSFLVIVFLTAYWIVRNRQIRQEKEDRARLARLTKVRGR